MMHKDMNDKLLGKKRTLQKLKGHLSHALSLLMVFLLLTAAAAWTGNLFGKHLGKNTAHVGIDNTLLKPNASQLKTLGLDEGQVKLEQADSASWMVTAMDGRPLGTIISSAPYAPHIKGFAGPTPLFIYVDSKGTIKQIAAQDNAETPDFFRRAFTTIAPQWVGLKADEAASKEVDAITGATFSSHAIISNVKMAMAGYEASRVEMKENPSIGWGRTVAVGFVLLMGCLIRSYFRGNKRLRVFQLLLNVGILGFWCGEFLSLSLLRGWIANGFSPVVYLPSVMILAVAVVFPFFKQKHHYCSWVCPLGSLQELASYVPVPKIHCSPTVYRAMSHIRMWTFAVLMLALWSGFGCFILDYEPFTAFIIQSAPPIVMGLAAVIIVASMFVPNVWCKSLCPMGMLLDLSEK